jgi:quaternary ammonium compound-resistance protein SugE
MAWFALLLAGFLEIAWALGLKYSAGFTRFWPSVATCVAILLSFGLLGVSLKSVPFGTAYAIWTGIGAAGAAIAGIVCVSAWNKDPVFGVIGVQSGPPH